MSDKGMAFMLAGLILGTFIALATGSVLVVSRWFPRLQMDPDSSDLGQMFAGAIGTMFALVFALVTIAVWGNYDRVSNGVGDEANCIHNIYRSLESYPPELRDPVQGLMRTYLKQVVQVEWPMMKEGREDPEARRLITEVNARISAYRPVALGELPLHQET